MTRLILMPGGTGIRADLILLVRVREEMPSPWTENMTTPAILFVHTTLGEPLNYEFDRDDLAEAERDRIIAEVNAATGGDAAEPTAVVDRYDDCRNMPGN